MLRVTVTAGVLQPWVLIQDPVTRDVAVSLPIEATTDAVIPNVASIPSGSRILWTSSLQISNPDPRERGARVASTYYPIGGSPTAPRRNAAARIEPDFGDVVAERLRRRSGPGGDRPDVGRPGRDDPAVLRPERRRREPAREPDRRARRRGLGPVGRRRRRSASRTRPAAGRTCSSSTAERPARSRSRRSTPPARRSGR